MKKILVFIMLFMLVFTTGCGKSDEKSVLKGFSNKVNDAKSYQIQGKLEITNNDDTYNYDVVASYKKDNNFRVSLKNKANNHEQVILKSKDGVYVLTPSLNKSFKFQSEWPYNNSQIYLLQSILKDLNEDNKKQFVSNDKGHIFTTKVNYPNNKKLVKQKISFDKNGNLVNIEVLNENDIVQMRMTFSNIDYKPIFDDKFFTIDDTLKNCDTCDNVSDKKTSGTLDDIIFPLYLPTGTKLTGQNKIKKTDGERVILTFEGEKPFTLVQETSSVSDEFAIVPTFGEPYLLIDTVGALSDNSVSWTSGKIDYYLVSDVMNQDELLEVAKSISVIPTLK